MSSTYAHSVQLDVNKCTGCTDCMKRCPTEAIRIRDGHAQINDARCIDCGECIRVCQNNAKKAVVGRVEDMSRFRYKIALPAPSLYGQFDNLDDVDYVLDGLLDLGFDDVFEVAKAAELVSAYTRIYLKTAGIKLPVISSSCPACVRLIALRFPSLNDNIMHMLPPMEVAAALARQQAKEQHPELADDEIGVCYIAPCPAQASYVKNGFADYESKIDVVISMSDIYFALISEMSRDKEITSETQTGMIGISWAISGGESAALFNDEYLAVDGIDNVIGVLEQIDNGNIPPVKFIELNACTAGCVGGVLSVQNPYIAKTRLLSLRRYLPVSKNFLTPDEQQYIPELYMFNELPEYEPISQLSHSMIESMRMMADIQRLRDMLPGIDCGACGTPGCRALAEDIVKGNATLSDCRILDKWEKRNAGK